MSGSIMSNRMTMLSRSLSGSRPGSGTFVDLPLMSRSGSGVGMPAILEESMSQVMRGESEVGSLIPSLDKVDDADAQLFASQLESFNMN